MHVPQAPVSQAIRLKERRIGALLLRTSRAVARLG